MGFKANREITSAPKSKWQIQWFSTKIPTLLLTGDVSPQTTGCYRCSLLDNMDIGIMRFHYCHRSHESIQTNKVITITVCVSKHRQDISSSSVPKTHKQLFTSCLSVYLGWSNALSDSGLRQQYALRSYHSYLIWRSSWPHMASFFRQFVLMDHLLNWRSLQNNK